MDLLQENAEKILMLMINLLFVAMIIIARSQLVNDYNHICNTETINLAPKNLHLSQSVLDKIKHYTIDDTATLLMDLLKHHDKDPDYIVYPRLERPSNELTGLFANNTMNSVFTAGVESTQQVESINDVFKKHLDRNTLLKKLGKVIEQKLENESQYTRIKDYYGSNPSSGLPLTYFTIFKDIDSVLKDYLSPIPLSLQQVNESNFSSTGIIEHIYDMPQIQLYELLLDIPEDNI
uniref:Uncharacterized protein n=1 Tax=Rhizophagus irregularis (strain DAOM 181602 / DAOM 197198 / MUCL 43194) TaxID=747089 RepID=U9TVI6_RHIID